MATSTPSKRNAVVIADTVTVSGNISATDLTLSGNLTVSGTQTTLNTATLQVEDKNIVLNYGTGDTSGSANGAGITIQDAVNSSTNATMNWNTSTDRFDFSHHITVPSGNSANWNTAYSWGNHASAGYLTSYTETDPTVPSHVKSITSTNISNWNTAYGWGNHASAGYLTSYTETDPTVPSHVKSITSTNISNWNTAYGWGNHASAGYLTSVPNHSAGLLTSGTLPDARLSSNVHKVTNSASTAGNGNLSIGYDSTNQYSYVQSHSSKPLRLNPVGNEVRLGTGNNLVFHDGYHPNADKWTTPRTISLSGDLSGSVSFDGSSNFTLSAQVSNDSHTHDGRYFTETESDGRYTQLNHFRSLGVPAFTAGGGSNSSTTTSALISEMEGDGAFDSYSSVFKTSWSYASNDNLSDAGRFTETAGTSWITWTDNSSDTTRGNITALAIAPNTGGSAGKVFIYNDQGSTYSPGWREVWTSTSDGAGSGLDADLLDGQQGSHYLNYNNLTNKPTVGNGTITINAAGSLTGGGNFTVNQSGNSTITITGPTIPTSLPANGGNADTVDNLHAASFIRSDAADTFTGNLTSGNNNWIRFVAANATDTNDGKIGAGVFSTGLNIVGAQTATGTGRQVRIWGEVITDGGNKYWHAGNDGSGSGLDADNLDGLDLHTGRNNEVNKVVRTDGNGYIQAGWINTTSGSTTGMDRIYASNDGYIRYVSKSTFGSGIAPHLTGIGSYTGDPGDNMLQYWQASSNTTLNPTTDWYNAIRMGHGDPVTYYANTIAVKMTGSNVGDLYTRTLSNGTQQSWNRHWHNNNDGSGSGLDADLLDGQHGSYYLNAGNLNAGTIPEARLPTISKYLRSDTADSWSGLLTYSGSNNGLEVGGIRGTALGSQTGDFIHLYERVNIGYPSGWGASGAAAPSYGLSTWGGAQINVGNVSGAPFTFNGNTVWHGGNDGSGSGLDADLLDGVQGSSYLRSDTTDTMSGAINFDGEVGRAEDKAYIEFYVHGSSESTYYPVVIGGASEGYAYKDYSISRRYNWTAPSSWNTSTHMGGLTLTWQHSGDTAWGGNDKEWRVIQFDESYTQVCQGLILATTGGMVVWLRGGGSNGARYRLHSPKGRQAAVTIYDGTTSGYSGSGTHSSSTTFTAGNGDTFSAESANTTTRDSRINPRWPVRDRGYLYHNGNAVWHTANDGSGSGLDADLLDGNQSSFFADKTNAQSFSARQTFATQTWNGDITWNTGKNILVGGESSIDVSGSGYFQIWDSGTGAPFIKCDVGSTVEIGNAGTRGLKVFGTTNSTTDYQVNGTTVINSSRNLVNIGSITTAGNALIGTTAATGWPINGARINDVGSALFSREASNVLFVNRGSTTRGNQIEFYSDEVKNGQIGYTVPYGGNMYITQGNTTGFGIGMYMFSTTYQINPVTHTGTSRDNQVDLGNSGARFDDVYATNGTIQTSDRNEKQDIQALSTAETAAATACKGLIRRFRWVDSVEEKGDNARYHFGAIAQDVEAAFNAQGLDAGDYGLFIRTTWWEHEGYTYPTAEAAPEGAVERTRLGIRYNQLLAFIISAL